MSLSLEKDNAFFLQQSTSLNNNNEHLFSIYHSMSISENNDRIFTIHRHDSVDSEDERLYIISRPTNIIVEVSVDTDRRSIWRYENPGYKEKLITFGGSCELDETKSKTGWGFWNRHLESMFDIKPTNELWAKFDIYISPNKTVYVYNNTSQSNDYRTRSGFRIKSYSSSNSNIEGASFLNGDEKSLPGISFGFHSILVHLKSGKENGIIQLWVDNKETQLCNRIGNVNEGNELKNFFIGVDNDQDAFVSNLIISNTELSFSDNCVIRKKHWHQPVLASNGTIGKNDLAVKRSDNSDKIYSIFTYNTTAFGERDYIEFYIKDSINIEYMYIVFDNAEYDLTSTRLYASYDGFNYDTICDLSKLKLLNRTLIVPKVPQYPYYRISGKDSNAIYNIIIDATVDELTLYLDTYRKSKYSTIFSEGLVLDGKTNYVEIPTEVTDDVTNWSAEFTIKTSESKSGNSTYTNPCLFGYDTAGNDYRDFHIDTKNGFLYVYSGLGNAKDPYTNGTFAKGSDTVGVDTGIKINDGELHTICVRYAYNILRVYCDRILAVELYPMKTLLANKLYFGSSFPNSKVFAALELYGAKIWKQGELVAEYSPSIKQVEDNKLYDLSGKNNHATLYGNPIKTVEGQVLSVDTSRHLTCSKMLGISETLARDIVASVRQIQDSNDEYSMLDVASILKTYKQS